MKTIVGFVSAVLMALSIPAFADKIIITGEPITLEQRGQVYYLPNNYTTTTGYYYIAIDGTQRVCYLEKQPALNALDLSLVSVNVNGQQVEWNCYSLDETYFTVNP